MSGAHRTPTDWLITLAEADDAPAVQSIYAPVVRDTAISFEVEVPDVAEIRRRITKTMQRWPWLVCRRGGAVLGYAYASEHRARAAYRWSVDVSVYIQAEARRSGVGRALYISLLNLVAVQGYCSAYAGITLPNAASVGLHQALGFTPVGVYHHVGFKHGAWHDVGWWERSISAQRKPPAPPLDLAAASQQEAWNAALAAGRTPVRSGAS